MDAWVEVIRLDGTAERHHLEEEQTTIGRSPMAGIPLVTADDLMPEHLLVAPQADGCWVALAEDAPPIALAGGPFHDGLVPWGTELSLGSVRLRLWDCLPAARSAGKGGLSTPLLIAIVILLPLTAWMLLSSNGDALPTGPKAAPPDLFSPAPACTDRGEAALLRARDAAEAASHKSERYVFDAQDGIDAVARYEEAEACFGKAGKPDDARRMVREREALQNRINEDYRTHQIRLDRALKLQRYDEALIEAHALDHLLRHESGPYSSWVRLLERRLQIIVDQQTGLP